MLHLPALVCHWANITHHISVRICQFLPLCFMLQSPTDFSLFQSRGEEKPGLAAAPVKNWEDFNTSSLLLVAGIDLVVAEQLYLDLIIPSHHAHQSISLIVGLFATS